MQLDSYLEIFTTLYGWAFANIIGELITGTGLIIIPFALIIFNGWRQAKEQGMQSGGVLGVIESVQTQLIIALFVFSVCFATTPLAHLSSTHLEFTPTASIENPAPETGTATSGAGTFNEAMQDAADGSMSDVGSLSQVPLWWYAVMSVSSGINNAVKKGLLNGSRDFRMVNDAAQMATIENPVALKAAQDFYNQCFLPARSRYMNMNAADISPAGQAMLDADNPDYGPSEVDWIGSQFFREEPRFYDSMRSVEPVVGFPVDFARDTDYYNPSSGAEPPYPGAVNPEWGRPTCNQWWEDPQNGVRAKLVGETTFWKRVKDRASNIGSWRNGDEVDQDFSRLASAKSNLQMVDSNNLFGSGLSGGMSRVWRGAVGTLSTIGVTMAAFLASIVMTPLMTALPMIQALVLMGLYMFLPLMMFLGGFSLRAMLYGAVALFTVKMWAALWFISSWVDAHLIEAMYPGGMGHQAIMDVLKIAFTAESVSEAHLYKRALLNILVMTLYIGLPVIWTTMMGWVGMRMGGQLDGMITSTSGQAHKIGSTSTSVATKGAGKLK